jgi:hypothetical protein
MLTLLALLAVAAPGPRATISAPPRPLTAGRAWNATLAVKPPPRMAPLVIARPPSGRSLVFRTRRVARGKYKVRLVLPRVGRWTVSTRLGGRSRVLRTVNVRPSPPPTSPLPGGTAYRVCGGAPLPNHVYPQYGLALGFGSAWIACQSISTVERVDLASGQVIASIKVSEPIWAVTAGGGAVWAIAVPGAAVHRIDPATNRVAAVIPLGARATYAWAGGGALWAADDDGHALIRFDPQTNAEVARVPVGDGPAGFAFDGSFVWILNHRENTLDRIDPATNGVVRMATIPGGDQVAAERITVFEGLLWITGRGLDLVRVSRSNGAVLGQTEIGAGGIDVVTDGPSLWVVPYELEADRRGEPIAAEVLQVDGTGAVVRRVLPTRRIHADGVAAGQGQLWLFDAVVGLLVRLPA